MRGEMRQKPQRNIIATGLLASGMSSLGIFRIAVLNNVLDTLGETGQTLPPPAKPSLEEFKEIYNTLKIIGLTSSIKFVKVEGKKITRRQEELDSFAANNDVVCYSMKLGQSDE